MGRCGWGGVDGEVWVVSTHYSLLTTQVFYASYLVLPFVR